MDDESQIRKLKQQLKKAENNNRYKNRLDTTRDHHDSRYTKPIQEIEESLLFLIIISCNKSDEKSDITHLVVVQ